MTPRRGVLALATFTAAATPATIALAADESPAPVAPAALPTVTAPAVAPVEIRPLTSEVELHDHVQAANRKLRRHNRAERRVIRVARKVAKLKRKRLGRGYALKLDKLTVAQLQRRHRKLSRTLRKLKRTGGAPKVAIPGHLAAIAACESGGNPRAIGGGGTYRGKYQFSYATWASVGGSGDPAAASETEQDRRAAILYAKAGAGQWPVCGA